jgi:hypothetical protein
MIAAVVALTACGTETGILVAVSGSGVDQLEFQVGVASGSDYFLDQEVSGSRYDVRGRDLRTSPFELMLRQDEAGRAANIRVLVMGHRGGKLVSYALLQPPQPFIADEVVRRNLTLANLGNPSALTVKGSSCFSVRRKIDDQMVNLTIQSKNDKDCDGATTNGAQPDCDDQDPTVHPAAEEVCDGKDNNCDGKYAAATSLACYGAEGTICRRGARTCDDKAGGMGPCTVTSSNQRVARAYCDAYAQCSKEPDPLRCADEMVQVLSAACTVEKDAVGICGGSYGLHPLAQATKCRWEIVSSGGFPVGLVQGTSLPALTAETCSPDLVMEHKPGPAQGQVVMEFFGDEMLSIVLQATIKTVSVETCGAEPLKCGDGSP